MRLARFIAILLIFSMSLSVITVIRGFTPEETHLSLFLHPNSSCTDIYKWPPRTVRIELRCSEEIVFQVYYYVNGGNRTIFRKYVERGIFTFHVQRRGLAYYVLIQNMSNKSVDVDLYITLYGFEKDLVQLSIFLNILSITMGLIWCVTSIIRKRYSEQ
nr:hypothetical protein [Candidatus Baldrarchaeota archaeon]